MPNKQRLFLVVNLLVLIVLAAGCNARLSKMVEEQNSPDTALIFGYIDMGDAPSNLEWADLRQSSLKRSDSGIAMRGDGEGLFYRENIPKGSYSLSSFGGRGWTLGCLSFGKERYYYQFPDEGFKYNKFNLTKTGLVFLGSYKMNKVKGKYQFVDAGSPAEKELLTRLLAYTAGTKWENVIKNRLKQL